MEIQYNQSTIPNFELFDQTVLDHRSRLLSHPLFSSLTGPREIRIFMEAHVFAVWDFMSLLKTLQIQLTGTIIPWQPPSHPHAARFINEIVIAEESDEIAPGRYLSHFELYLAAMRECEASTFAIEALLTLVSKGESVGTALLQVSPPSHVKEFVQTTFSFCQLRPHQVAAAFLFGREDIIPDMFQNIIMGSKVWKNKSHEKLELYLKRHIEVDGENHGPMALKLIESLCGNNSLAWTEVQEVAIRAIQARCRLWDGVLKQILRSQET